MKKLINFKTVQIISYTYDSIDEWNEHNKEMLENGWKEYNDNFFSNDKYYQQYIKE